MALKKVKVQSYRIWVGASRPRDPADPLLVSYKATKRKFGVAIKGLAKKYETEEISKAARLAEVDRNSYWRLIKRCRNSNSSSNISISNAGGVVVNQVNDVLEVWQSHFANLGTPKTKPNFDEEHFRMVTNFTKLYNEGKVVDDNFLKSHFS